MNLLELQVSNFKRIRAVRIRPDVPLPDLLPHTSRSRSAANTTASTKTPSTGSGNGGGGHAWR